jgi:oxygen-independent coproporphyrinogen-3 oxidase
MSDIALYIHIPFCKSKCLYCDFLSFAGREARIDEYVKALIKEIRGFETDKTIGSIFIGGGTPSVIDSTYIVEIMNAVYDKFNVGAAAEITIESNPGTVDEHKLRAYRSCGINRISFGVQSCSDELLKTIGRIHTYKDVKESVSMAKSAGFDNINCDLMFSLPRQSCDEFLQAIEAVSELGVSHISAYSLIVEEGTPFYKMYESGELAPIDDELDRKMYHEGVKLLEAKGYKQYEISNFALDGKECRHNLVYWRRGEYKGFGLGAASLLNETRLKNTEDFFEYINGKNEIEEEKLSLTDRQEEFMFLGLRCSNGICEKDFLDAFGVDIDNVYASQLNKLEDEGLLVRSSGRIYLTERGIDISNMVFVEFLRD